MTEETLKEGLTFPSWEEFAQYLANFCRENHVVYTIVNCKTIECANRRLCGRGNAILHPKKLKYSFVRYGCKHYGTYTSSSTGWRPKQKTYKMGCPSTILISSDRKRDCLVVKQVKMEHNHPVTIHQFLAYPETRRLDIAENAVVSQLLKFQVRVSKIREYLNNNFRKSVTSKDIHNLRAKLNDDDTDEQKVLKAIEDIFQFDPTAIVVLHINNNSVLDGFSYKSTHVADVVIENRVKNVLMVTGDNNEQSNVENESQNAPESLIKIQVLPP